MSEGTDLLDDGLEYLRDVWGESVTWDHHDGTQDTGVSMVFVDTGQDDQTGEAAGRVKIADLSQSPQEGSQITRAGIGETAPYRVTAVHPQIGSWARVEAIRPQPRT